MRHVLGWCLVACLGALSACSADNAVPPRARDAGPDSAAGSLSDTDGDGITDGDEGAAERRDTDGDGTADYLDDDSDADGIADADEAGDSNPSSPPIDSDMDVTPNYIDTDSDDNGIPDSAETRGDVDADGIADYADLDDDGDFVRDGPELMGMREPPVDFDGDGAPDHQDPDSDNDTILDGHERDLDTDHDMLVDVHDLDSDGDGLLDATEAGDADTATPPVDTDMDGMPDFRDVDSDDDGLSDDAEVIEGTSPTTADTDGDGVSDLIEIGAGTSALDPADSPRTRGDFVFVVPFEAPPDPPRDTLMFRTSIQFADVYFLFDISGSMSGEITALRDAVGTVMSDLTCAGAGVACTRDAECAAGEVCSPFSSTCIEDPGASSCILSAWTGTGYYEAALVNGLSLQSDPAMTRAAIRTTTFGGTEELDEALLAIADPSMAAGETGCVTPGPGLIGCPGFREEAVRIVVAFTDEDSDGAVTAMAAGTALSTAGITVIGVWSGSPGATTRAELVDVVRESGSLDRTGAPLVFDGMDATVVPAVTMAINEIVEGVPLRVTIVATDEPDDPIDALQFIEALETNTTGPGCSAVPTEDSDGDGIHETYPAVTPGTPVCWDVVARMNTTVMPATTPQVFRARLTVYGDGSPLDSRLVYFLVPPRIVPPGGPD